MKGLWEQRGKKRDMQAAKLYFQFKESGNREEQGARQVMYTGVHHTTLSRCSESSHLSHRPLQPLHRQSQNHGAQGGSSGSQMS